MALFPSSPVGGSQPPTVDRLATSEPFELAKIVQGVLASATFKRSPRLSQLLAYLAYQTQSGAKGNLKEAAIGQAVFGRSATYNAAEDNIVRSNVRQLRFKLEEYYASPGGAAEEWRISVPKGSYNVVLIQNRSGPEQSFQDPEIESQDPRVGARIWRTVACLACLILGGVGGYFLHQEPAQVPAKAPESLISLLNPGPGRRVLVVVPDAGVQLYQRLTNRTVDVNRYVSVPFENAPGAERLPAVFAPWASDLFHSSTTQSFILNLIPPLLKATAPVDLSLRHPSNVVTADFERDNALLISGPFGNPWVQLFDRDLNFQITFDQKSRAAKLINRHPNPGEKTEYVNYTEASGTVVCYARLAYLPGLSTTSRILLMGGPHNVSTEAAALFVTRPNILRQLCRIFHVDKPAALPWFELVINRGRWGMRRGKTISSPTGRCWDNPENRSVFSR